MTLYRPRAGDAQASPAPATVASDDLIVYGVSLGHPDHAAAEHWLSTLPVAPVVACTHLVADPYPHVAVSLAVPPDSPPVDPGDPDLRVAADAAAAAHRARRSGRAVLFPGVERLTGVRTVGQLAELSGIERVRVLGSAEPPSADTEVDTRDHVRPQWMDGVLTLVTTPCAGGRIAPFEVPSPTPCCADH